MLGKWRATSCYSKQTLDHLYVQFSSKRGIIALRGWWAHFEFAAEKTFRLAKNVSMDGHAFSLFKMEAEEVRKISPPHVSVDENTKVQEPKKGTPS
jgi:hypothetical protein